MSFAKREISGLCAFLRRGRSVPHALPFRPARKSCFLRLALIAALASPALLAARDVLAESGGDSLAPRIRFQAELPPWCESGWRGQGHGIVAVCRLNGRTQVRLIGGRVLPCARPDCADRQRIIKASLRRYR